MPIKVKVSKGGLYRAELPSTQHTLPSPNMAVRIDHCMVWMQNSHVVCHIVTHMTTDATALSESLS